METKVQEFSEIVRICKQKRQTGDYLTLAKILDTTVDAIRMRLNREDKKTYLVLYELIEQRDLLKQKYQNKASK